MLFHTQDLRRACQLLSISVQEIANAGETTEHMSMARLVARELSLLSYEEAAELFEADGEIIVELTPRRRLLYLAPGVRHVPGDGLPTEEELLEIERQHALDYRDMVDRARAGTPREGDNYFEFQTEDGANGDS